MSNVSNNSTKLPTFLAVTAVVVRRGVGGVRVLLAERLLDAGEVLGLGRLLRRVIVLSFCLALLDGSLGALVVFVLRLK